MKRVEVLLAAVGNDNIEEIVRRINILSPAIVANQADMEDIKTIDTKNGLVKMVTTKTRGVGINRNIALSFAKEEYLLFLDDDMVLNDNYENIVREAFDKLKEADIIIFNFNFVSPMGEQKRFEWKTKLNMFNGLKYGICAAAIKRKSLIKSNLCFSTLFGGGCLYGSGEDSLFFLEALRKNLKIYTWDQLIGKNYVRESSWFTGFNEKYFYDKGAWIACAFPKRKAMMILYYYIRFYTIAECTPRQMYKMLKDGCQNYNQLIPYNARI